MQTKACLSTLDLTALEVPNKGQLREVWALLSLAQAVGEQQDPTLCSQERGALAYQVRRKSYRADTPDISLQHFSQLLYMLEYSFLLHAMQKSQSRMPVSWRQQPTSLCT